MRRLLLVLAVTAGMSACRTREPVAPVPPYNGDVCENLAHTFFVIADYRDRGRSRATQVRELRESVKNPFTRHPDKTFEKLVGVVDYVYANESVPAAELEAQVLDECTISAEGHAVVRLPAPGAPKRLAEPDDQARNQHE